MNYSPEMIGCGRYTGELCADLARRGHDVTVVAAPPHYPAWRIAPGARNAFYLEPVDGAPVYRCPLLLISPMHGVRRIIAPLTFALSSIPVVVWRIVFHRPDAILIVQPTLLCIPVAVMLARILRVRTCLHVQDLEVDAAFATGHLRQITGLKKLLLWIEQTCLRAFDAIITISRSMGSRLAEKGVDPARISIVRNWVDIAGSGPDDAASEIRDALGIGRDKFVVLYSGNIGPKQGLDTVVEAARLLAQEEGVTFVIAGQGPSRAALEMRAAGLSNMVFLPLQPPETFGAFLRMCDLHVLPQVARAADLVLPSKLGGMLASGRPVIATAESTTELAQILAGAATVVPPEDPEALAAAIRAERSGECSNRRARRLDIADQWSREDATRRIEMLLLDAGSLGPPVDVDTSVSVVIPYFNASATLPAALASVAAQTRAVTEIIVVDDASCEAEAEAARRTIAAFPNVRIVSRPHNGGASAARNLGVREAHGPYVAFLDADDRWLPQKIQICLETMLREKLDFLGHATLVGGKRVETVSDALRKTRLYDMKPSDIFISTSQFAPSTVVFRKGALPVEFDESVRRSEDFRLWGDLLFRGYRLSRLRDALTERDDPHIRGSGVSGDVAGMLAAHLGSIDHFRASGLIGRISHGFMRAFLRARFSRHG